VIFALTAVLCGRIDIHGRRRVPPLAPALADAWFALTGARRRLLPFSA
jgi:hypothetical protein